MHCLKGMHNLSFFVCFVTQQKNVMCTKRKRHCERELIYILLAFHLNPHSPFLGVC